jgi:hypothetical protein
MCAKEIRNTQRGNQLAKESDQAVETRGPPTEHDPFPAEQDRDGGSF